MLIDAAELRECYRMLIEGTTLTDATVRRVFEAALHLTYENAWLSDRVMDLERDQDHSEPEETCV